MTTGTIALNFDESVHVADGAEATLTNANTNSVVKLAPTVNGNVIRFSYSALDKSAKYNFELPANTVSDLSGNVLAKALTFSFITADTNPIPAPTIESKNHLWYNKPAGYWEEALPLGNGRLGVMHSGSVACDTLQLNEDTFWDQGRTRTIMQMLLEYSEKYSKASSIKIMLRYRILQLRTGCRKARMEQVIVQQVLSCLASRDSVSMIWKVHRLRMLLMHKAMFAILI